MKNLKIIDKPQGIIKTLPLVFFEEYSGGVNRFRKEFESLNKPGTRKRWMINIPGIPQYEVLYIYILYHGHIRYRANIVEYKSTPEGSITFIEKGKERTVNGKHWIIMSAPVVPAPVELPMKGFQGFRYTQLIF